MNTDSTLRVGVAMTGSFCTFERAFAEIKKLAALYDLYPIMSPNAAAISTRFGSALDNVRMLEAITGKPVMKTIAECEPIGPLKKLDVLVVIPCTGNTMAKVACGITDTSVTMAVKAQLRNSRPVVLAPSTNDGLGINAINIARLLSIRNIYFVPFMQDDAAGKPNSIVADMSLISEAVAAAVDGRRLEPMIRQK